MHESTFEVTKTSRVHVHVIGTLTESTMLVHTFNIQPSAVVNHNATAAIFFYMLCMKVPRIRLYFSEHFGGDALPYEVRASACPPLPPHITTVQ